VLKRIIFSPSKCRHKNPCCKTAGRPLF